MSWGGLPWWVYQVVYEHDLAKMACCFESEWFAGTHKECPPHIIWMSRATFKSHEEGGCNCISNDTITAQCII